MKRAVFHSIMVLVLVLGLTISMAVPVAAQTTSVTMFLTVDLPTTTNSQGEHTYTIIVTNQAIDGAVDSDVTVTFYPPGPTGAVGEYGDPVPIDTNRTIAVGETVVYNWNGDGGAEARPQLEVSLPGIPLNEGVGEVYARCTVYAFYDPHDDTVDRNVPASVIWPDTEVNIEARAASGDSVILTITEANTGEEDLTDVYVQVWKKGVLFATLDETTLGWSSDDNMDDVLDVGETWSWTIDSGPITSETEFVALGFGTDPLDLEVSYDEGFLGERYVKTIGPSVGGVASPVSRLALLVPWIVLAGLIAGAAVFVWSRRAQGRA